MSQALPVGDNGPVASPEEYRNRAVDLLDEVLRLVDAAQAPADIGALIQTAHDELERYRFD
ncbi:MAG TPA: hypothetical protein VK474_07970 [Chthoniobacterales bacterium]|nr:hypothetical protein [Chthoniobacterales bacterium]